jgi:hypothetical protein
MHTVEFTEYAATDEAHRAAIQCGKGMAIIALRLLTDPRLCEDARKAFDSQTS